MRQRRMLLAVVTAISLGSLGARSASACAICKDFTMYILGFPIGSVRQSCVPVLSGETGATECTVYSVGSSTFCTVGGDFCSTITVLGGGCTVDAGAPCPPSCSSCNRVGP